MKRVIAILKGKLEDVKLDNKLKRINNALETVKLNAETELMELDAKMDETVAKLSTEVETYTVISNLKEIFDKKAEIFEGLNTIKAIEKYLNEEVTVEKGK